MKWRRFMNSKKKERKKERCLMIFKGKLGILEKVIKKDRKVWTTTKRK